MNRELKQVYNDLYSHTVPLSIKVLCSILMWFPVVVSFISIWYLPKITIIYNIIICIYIIISVLLMYLTCLVAFFKQRQILRHFFTSSKWINMKNSFINNHKNKLQNSDNNIEDILHMIIVPIYKEDPLIIHDTLKSLGEQNVSLIIGFALEELEINSDSKYNHIIEKYEHKFIKIIKTIHPCGLKNEIASKSSNCNYCAQILVQYYEDNLKEVYNHAMITVCDCDSIWCQDYFLYLNYLCTKNNLNHFNNITYTPNITNFKNFQFNHVLTNWMSIIRMIATHGHFRFLGYIRCFTSEYHIPLKLLKQIDYWDTDLVHEDVHMYNKLAILDKKSVMFKCTFLPCDNQTPTNINSIYQSYILLWNQSLRWNFFIYDLYYLFYQLLLNLFKIKNYENFQINSWKVFIELLNNYENLFFYFYAPMFNMLFWIFYVNLFKFSYYNDLIIFLLDYLQPCFIVTQIFLLFLWTLLFLNIGDKNTKGEFYNWKKHSMFMFGLLILPVFAFTYQIINLFFAWIHTLKSSFCHSEPALKIVSISKDK